MAFGTRMTQIHVANAMTDFPAFFAALDAAPFAARRSFVQDPGWKRSKNNHYLFKAGGAWHLIAEKEGMIRAIRIDSFLGHLAGVSDADILTMLQSFDT